MISLRHKRPRIMYSKEYEHIRRLTIAHRLIIAILSLGFVMFGYGVYRIVWTTIGQLGAIVSLQLNLQIEPVDFARLEKVKERWQAKHASAARALAGDPFQRKNLFSTTTLSLPPVTSER